MKYAAIILSFVMSAMTVCSCLRSQVQEYNIGVSQCSTDDWRVKMNNEMQLEAFFYPGLNLEIRSAEDDSRRQIQDIEYFISQGVDLLVVAPNEAEPVTPAVEKALEQGIPVVIVDRKIASDNMTAFIGADNYQIGKSIGHYVSRMLRQGGNVVELTGLMSSSPAQERHNGFVDVLKENKEINLMCSRDAQWQEKTAYGEMLEIISEMDSIDLVFAHNDMMAYGAFQAAKSMGMEQSISFVGIDALAGTSGGVNLVLEGVLDASFVYPTGGDKVIQTAMNILQGHDYKKNYILETAFVDRSNAELMRMQSSHLSEQEMKIRSVNGKLHTLSRSYNIQKILLWTVVSIMAVAIILIAALAVLLHQRNSLNKELNNSQDKLEKLSSELEAATQNNHLQNFMESEFDVDETKLSAKDREFIMNLKELINNNMSNSDLTVDWLSEELGFSRVQFYRIMKRLSGISPHEFVRNCRLRKAKYLLLSTDMTIAEICYETGFNTPSYFTRCFKEYYNKLPSDYVRMRE